MKQKFINTGLVAALLPSIIMAAPPVDYDGWSVSGGTIDTSTSCGLSGVSCTTMAEDNGFVEEKVVVDNYEYIRLVVTEPDVNGNPGDQAFSSEFFIPFATADAGISQGVASKQVVRDAAEGFTSQAELQRAMMRFRDPGLTDPFQGNGGTPADEMWSIRLNQSFALLDMTSSFQYTGYTAMASSFPAATPDTDTVIGYSMSMSQNMLLLNPFVDPDISQHFEHREVSGVSGNIASLFFPSNYFASEPITPAGSMTLGGSTVSWSEEATVSTNWLAQTDMFDASKATMQYQDVPNHDTSATASELSTTAAATPVTPFDWDEPTFGLTPSFP